MQGVRMVRLLVTIILYLEVRVTNLKHNRVIFIHFKPSEDRAITVSSILRNFAAV